MQTIVELPEFLRKSRKLLRASERQGIINYLALQPESGDVLQGTGGIRKFRWSAQGKGEKDNISKRERNELAAISSQLVRNYGGQDE